MKLNHQGFGLVQVLVAVGMLSVLTLMLASVISNSYKHEAQMAVLLEGRELSGEFIELSHSPNCGIVDLKNPISVTDPTWNVQSLYSLPGGLSGRFLNLKSGSKYGKLQITEISLAPYLDKTTRASRYIAMDGSDPTDYANTQVIKASIKIDLSSNNGVKAPVQVPVYLYLDPTKSQILSCDTVDGKDNLADMCQAMGGVWSTTDSTCSLPCPAGMNMVAGVCTTLDNNGTYCKVNEKCGVNAKYTL